MSDPLNLTSDTSRNAEIYYPETTLGIRTQKASEIKKKPLVWLWKGWLLEGKLHILGGEKATGKTTIALDIAARISRGEPWPDGSQGQKGSVLIWSGEDDIADTLIPRLEVAGADMTKIHFVKSYRERDGDRAFDPACDFGQLGQRLAELRDCKLLIIDPIVSVVKGNANHNNDVRKALAPIISLAQERKCAVIGITHLTKNSSESSLLDRITGSLAFTAASRVVWVAKRGITHDGKDRRAIAQIASNLGGQAGGIFYDVAGTEIPELNNSYSRISWEDTFSEDIDTLFKANRTSQRRKTDEAAELIANALDKGPVKSNLINQALRESGYSKGTIDSAKKLVGVLAVKSEEPNGPWLWTKRCEDPKEFEDPKHRLLGSSMNHHNGGIS